MVRRRSMLLAALLAALPPAWVRADSLILQGLSPQTVTVTGFEHDTLQYRTSAGSASSRPYDKVKQLIVEGESALSSAEASNASGNAAASIDDYAKAIRSTNTAWVKAYAARRLLDALGPGGGRFEARLAAYLALLQTAPADAEAHKPALPDKGSRLLDVAVDDTESALKTPKLDEATTASLLNFLIELHRQRGDDAAVAATVERLAKASPTAANDPAVRGRLTGLKIAQARVALDRRDYVGARGQIDAVRADLTDPKQQSDALLVLAACAEGTADPTDKSALTDAALAYMRVVAVADPLPGRPNVLESLRATASILERTGDAVGAKKVLTQITQEFAGDPAAVQKAKADLARLGG